MYPVAEELRCVTIKPVTGICRLDHEYVVVEQYILFVQVTDERNVAIDDTGVEGRQFTRRYELSVVYNPEILGIYVQPLRYLGFPGQYQHNTVLELGILPDEPEPVLQGAGITETVVRLVTGHALILGEFSLPFLIHRIDVRQNYVYRLAHRLPLQRFCGFTIVYLFRR